MRVIFTTDGKWVVVAECAHRGPVNDPFDALTGPVDRVGMELGLWAIDWIVDRSVVGSGVAFAEEVGLDSKVDVSIWNYLDVLQHRHSHCRVAPQELPINLIEIIRLEDNRADDTSTRCGLHLHINPAEEDVEVCLDGRRFASLCNCELGTRAAIFDSSICRSTP